MKTREDRALLMLAMRPANADGVIEATSEEWEKLMAWELQVAVAGRDSLGRISLVRKQGQVFMVERDEAGQPTGIASPPASLQRE